jgi:hypothetical protein
MLVKSLAVSVAAALLGPTLGIATFFLANSNSPSSRPLSTSQHQQVGLVTPPAHREVIRSFAPSETWYGPRAEVRKLDTAAVDLPRELGAWQTVVRCPEGQALSEDGRCWSSNTRPPT